MSNWLNAAAVTTAALIATAAPAEAQLLGVKVEGSYIQNANPGLNLFTTLNTSAGGSMPVGIQAGTGRRGRQLGRLRGRPDCHRQGYRPVQL